MDFFNKLINIKKATKKQKRKELWDIEGIIKNYSNQNFKFDTRPSRKFKENDYGKRGSFKSKADKMVFETRNQWIVIDMEEMHQYLKDKNVKDIGLNDLISKLECNIVLSKN